ncbi:MAG: hypothetical protein SFV51_12180 [Bryobacteraceae bacterium]|nr:hypothetical protein [Bryobacteraceae bacterium]
MGFALWIKDGLSWAQGTHEYRPMGVAVISATDHFRPRDFHPARRCPSREAPAFAGFFASIGEMNSYLERKHRSRAFSKKSRKKLSSGVSIL